MKRGSVSFALALVLVALIAGCVKTTEMNPGTLDEEEAAALEEYVGNVRLEMVDGTLCTAQTLRSAVGDSLHLLVVEIVRDGVVTHRPEYQVAKSRVASMTLSKNNPWAVGGALAGISALILVLYYQINGSF